jgi:DNA-binding CsgD family transcriptional regulator
MKTRSKRAPPKKTAIASYQPRFCPYCGSVLPVRKKRGNPNPDLTPRQKEVIRLIATGQTAKEIAETLGLSRRTVEFHRAMLMQRLRITTTAELTLWAAAHGLV